MWLSDSLAGRKTSGYRLIKPVDYLVCPDSKGYNYKFYGLNFQKPGIIKFGLIKRLFLPIGRFGQNLYWPAKK